MIQDFLSHGISIPIGSSNKFTKKLVKILHQNCNRLALVIAKILLYREGGGILYYVCYILHNNHVLGNASLHIKKHQQ